MKKVQIYLVSSVLMAALTILAMPSQLSAKGDDEKDAFVGVVEKIDADAKKVYVKSTEGVVKAFKWTKKSTVHGVTEAAIWTDHAAHTGAHVVVRSLKVAGGETIQGIHWFGQGTAKVVSGTVKHVGKGTKKVAIVVAEEAEQIYDVSEHAVVRTGKAVVHGTKHVEKNAARSVKATIHVFERDGKKVVHFFHFNDKRS